MLAPALARLRRRHLPPARVRARRDRAAPAHHLAARHRPAGAEEHGPGAGGRGVHHAPVRARRRAALDAAGVALRSRGRTRSGSSTPTARCAATCRTSSSPWSASMAHDDPEGLAVYQECLAHADRDPSIIILSNMDNVGAVEVNAFQCLADVVVQKSIREGFGLTVSEALWKGRPTVGGAVGGIRLQIEHGVTGWLCDSPETCAEACLEVLHDPDDAHRIALAGKEHVRRNFLTPRLVLDWLRLLTALREGTTYAEVPRPSRAGAVVSDGPRRRLLVASNRGPVSYGREGGQRTVRRGGGGLVTALAGLVAAHDVTWIAAAISAEDRVVAAESGAPGGGARPCRQRRSGCGCSTSTPSTTTATTTRSPTRSSGSSSTTSGTTATPRRSRRPRTWRGTRTRPSTRRFAEAIAAEAEGADAVLVHDYHLYCVPEQLRRLGSGPPAPALHARALARAAGLARAADADARGHRARRARGGHRRLPHRARRARVPLDLRGPAARRRRRPRRPLRDGRPAAHAGARLPDLRRPRTSSTRSPRSPAVLAAEESVLRARPGAHDPARRPHRPVQERRARLPGPRPPAGEAPGPVRPA